MNQTTLELLLEVKDQASAQLQGASKKIGRSFDDIARQARAAGAAMTAAGGAILFGAKQAIDASSDLEESVNAVNVIFGEASQSLIDFGQQAATSAGLSQRAFNQAAVPIGAQLKNMGFAAEEAAEQTITLTQRAADLASVFNTDVDQALNAIGSGLRGESEPLKQFGVGLTQAAIEAYALTNGLAATKGEIDANIKAQATLGVIMEQTNQVQGDFVNTADSYANANRIAAAQVENLAAQIGSNLQPIIVQIQQALLPIITAVNKWIQDNPQLAATITQVVVAIGALMLVVGPLLIALPALAAGISTLFGPVGIALGLFTALIAILVAFRDELAAMAERINAMAVIETLRGWLEALRTSAMNLWTTLQENGVIDNITDALTRLWENIETNLWPAIQNLWANLEQFWPILEMTAKIFGVILYVALLAFINVLNLAITVITTGINIASELANMLGTILKPAIDIAGAGFEWLMGIVQSAVNIVNTMITAVNNLTSAIGRLFSKAGSGGGGILSSIGNIFSGNRATGGFVRAGGAYQVGENGPETFVPSVNGTIIPNGRGGTSIQVNVTGNQISNQVDMEELAETVGDAIIRNLNTAYNV